MIETTVAMAALAALFVLFGLLHPKSRKGCEGACDTCANECEHDMEARIR
jgi:hypothetical protein